VKRILSKFQKIFTKKGIVNVFLSLNNFISRLNKKIHYKNMLSQKTNKERFSEIYRKNIWQSNESGSGKGSEVLYTENLRNWLLEILPKYKVEKFVDAACGDFNWMRLVIPKLDIKYEGIDIVDKVIEENNLKHSNNKINFLTKDICKDPLPNCDMLMIRDCLFHLSFSDINNLLKNLKKTDYKFLLTTTHILEGNHNNKDIISGDFRLINIFSEPFNFKQNRILDRCQDSILNFAPREMVLISKEDIPENLSFRSN